MSRKPRLRRLYLIIGKQQSGKSTFTAQLASDYCKAGGAALIYNIPRPTDFAQFAESWFLDADDHLDFIENRFGKEAAKKYKKRPIFRYYRDQKGAVRDMKNYFADWKGQGLKFPLSDMTNLFCETVLKYVYNTFIVFDDARILFRNGVDKKILGLFTQINHTGKRSHYDKYNYGSDIALVFHSLDQVNKELFHLATHIVQFRTEIAPQWQEIGNPALERELRRGFEALRGAPPYYKILTDIEKISSIALKP